MRVPSVTAPSRDRWLVLSRGQRASAMPARRLLRRTTTSRTGPACSDDSSRGAKQESACGLRALGGRPQRAPTPRRVALSHLPRTNGAGRRARLGSTRRNREPPWRTSCVPASEVVGPQVAAAIDPGAGEGFSCLPRGSGSGCWRWGDRTGPSGTAQRRGASGVVVNRGGDGNQTRRERRPRNRPIQLLGLSVLLGGDDRLQLLERLPDQARDVHLRHAQDRADLALLEVHLEP
jgi:hypothetical protein